MTEPMIESIRIRNLDEADREAIATWRYPGALSIYDPGCSADQLRAPDHVALSSADGALLGYGTFGAEGRVAGGRYDETALDVGMGLRPDWVGRGLGPAALSRLISYARLQRGAERLRATVADANPRAGALVRDLGFVPAHRFARAADRRAFTQFEHDEDSERVAAFIRDGYWPLRGVVAPEIVAACRRDVTAALAQAGVDDADPTTWTRPVVRLDTPRTDAMSQVRNHPRLLSICDRLLGPGRRRPRHDLGGTTPVRFPSPEDPGDAGWHIDGSYDVGGQWWTNVFSKERGLLLLVLLSDVNEASAPTELLVGSHLDVPRVLEPHGRTGTLFDAAWLPASTFERARVLATGAAGDMFVCHPFLVHRATWPHHGARPRALAQPEIAHDPPFSLEPRPDLHPVEHAICKALASHGRPVPRPEVSSRGGADD